MAEYALTGVGYPDPFKKPDEWMSYDFSSQGFHLCERLGALANTSYLLSDEANDEEILNAMKLLVADNPLLLRIVTKTD